MVPGGMGGQAAHGHGSREAAVDEERTALLQQVDEPIQAVLGEVWQPRRAEFANAILGKHGQSPSGKGGFKGPAASRGYYRPDGPLRRVLPVGKRPRTGRGGRDALGLGTRR